MNEALLKLGYCRLLSRDKMTEIILCIYLHIEFSDFPVDQTTAVFRSWVASAANDQSSKFWLMDFKEAENIIHLEVVPLL